MLRINIVHPPPPPPPWDPSPPPPPAEEPVGYLLVVDFWGRDRTGQLRLLETRRYAFGTWDEAMTQLNGWVDNDVIMAALYTRGNVEELRWNIVEVFAGDPVLPGGEIFVPDEDRLPLELLDERPIPPDDEPDL